MADKLAGEIEKALKDNGVSNAKTLAPLVVAALTDDGLIDEISARNYLVDKSRKDKVEEGSTLTDTQQALFDRGYEAGFAGTPVEIAGEPELTEFYKMGYKAGETDRKANEV